MIPGENEAGGDSKMRKKNDLAKAEGGNVGRDFRFLSVDFYYI